MHTPRIALARAAFAAITLVSTAALAEPGDYSSFTATKNLWSQGDATAIRLIAEATASAVQAVASAISQPGGDRAANLKIAEQYIIAFGNLAKVNNTMIVPANLADVSSLMATAMTVLDRTRTGGETKAS